MEIPLGTQAQWLNPELVHLSSDLRDWLTDAGSLTAKLKALHANFHVHVLCQRQGFADDHEYRQLGLDKQPVTLREVLLYCNGLPWVFARSVLPHEQLEQSAEITRLGNNPLGEHLFQRQDITPGQIEVASFAPNSNVGTLNQTLHGKQMTLWGRRRCFHLPETSILVAEVFLSPTPCYAYNPTMGGDA